TSSPKSAKQIVRRMRHPRAYYLLSCATGRNYRRLRRWKFLSNARNASVSDKAFAFQMKDNLLSCLIGSQVGRVYGDVGVSRFFVRIRDAGKLLNNTGARFGIKTFAVTLFANFHR